MTMISLGFLELDTGDDSVQLVVQDKNILYVCKKNHKLKF